LMANRTTLTAIRRHGMGMTMDKILARYPKTRPRLPEEYRQIYAEEYLANRKFGHIFTK
jgi:hypothetical protein